MSGPAAQRAGYRRPFCVASLATFNIFQRGSAGRTRLSLCPSANGFLQNLALWPNMQSCILWVHSPAKSFSQAVIQAFAQRQKPPHIIEVLGSQATPTDLSGIAKLNPIRRTTVRLGRHQEPTGGRWLTHREISAKVALPLMKDHPTLGLDWI